VSTFVDRALEPYAKNVPLPVSGRAGSLLGCRARLLAWAL